MIKEILYILFLLLEFIFVLSLCIYFISMIFSSIKGAPYVPTKKRDLLHFLNQIGLKKGQLFLELGSGDGRVVMTAVKEYGVKGTGIDINALLVFWARLKAKLAHVTNVVYKTEDVRKTDVSKADIIYMFLMPQFIEKIRSKLETETKKGALIVSHGFKIVAWQKYLVKKIEAEPFPTYFYRIK